MPMYVHVQMQNRHIQNSRRFMYDIRIDTSKIDTYRIYVDLCRTHEKYTSKIDTYRIHVDSCRTYEKKQAK